MVRLSYKLTKRTTKLKNLKNPLKIIEMYIKNFKTIRSKLTASSNIIHAILINKLMGLFLCDGVNFLLLPKE